MTRILILLAFLILAAIAFAGADMWNMLPWKGESYAEPDIKTESVR